MGTLNLPTIETTRLVLRPIDLNDTESIFAYAKNSNVSKYTLWEAHQSVQDTQDYIQEYIFDYYSKGISSSSVLGYAYIRKNS